MWEDSLSIKFRKYVIIMFKSSKSCNKFGVQARSFSLCSGIANNYISFIGIDTCILDNFPIIYNKSCALSIWSDCDWYRYFKLALLYLIRVKQLCFELLFYECSFLLWATLLRLVLLLCAWSNSIIWGEKKKFKSSSG